MSNIAQTPQPVTVRPKRAIGQFTDMLVISESATDDLEITQHPVQQGAAIADHVYKKPATITVTAMWNQVDKSLDEIYADLLNLQASRQPFDVVTGKRIYSNMIMKGLSQTTDRATENVLSVTATMQQIIIAQVEVVTIPPKSRQRNSRSTGQTENAGTKQAQTVDDPKKQSALFQAFG